ncbi:MAG TPA: neutral/alkaline non-lysosomal ceramidase N-terminal domain-containing protein [Verrucomicrobiota bacterium]|nr:neutral/alkaline non-lysosomal ceramidase N-terminal domain-containing protein [Verrucomicrobiota bacterium]HQL77425.1 neutral/alkaline non-lysosomal ceramidase N-terminal domain-containing protein [Verrucomicrobiota bacterium]
MSARLWKVGVARSNITPTNSLWMAGYAARTRPAEGKATELWLKALALQDTAGHRAVVVSADLLAIRGGLYRRCLPRLKEKFGLEPAQILLTASHTHCGPLRSNRRGSLGGLAAKDRGLTGEYEAALEEKIIQTAGRALAALAPARLVAGGGKTDFAANRRNNRESERVRLAAEGALAGPVDHAVPVLGAYRPDGKVRAVLFGYACHNTTLTGSFCQWCGDYAGFAQAVLEKSHPGAMAVFFVGCAGDQDPLVRGSLDLARRYGQKLAGAVEEDLNEPCPALVSPLWGYEGCQAMKVLGLPALRWADDVEELATAGARRLVKQVNGRQSGWLNLFGFPTRLGDGMPPAFN